MCAWRKSACALAVWLFVSAGAVSGAVADYVGRPVSSVQFVIEGREVIDDSLADVVETTVGQPLSMTDVRETIGHLFAVARFDDVQVDATIAGGQVGLRYLLTPIHIVDRIEFSGDVDGRGVSKGALRRALADRFGAGPSARRADEMARLVEERLRQSGYLHAAVTPHAALRHEVERATLDFTIRTGARTTIGAIDVTGIPSTSRDQLLEDLEIEPGAAYEREALDARIGQYVDDQRQQGFYEAKVQLTVQLAEDDRVANLALAVAPGPHVRVVFKGDSIPTDKRAELVPIEREGSVSEDVLEDATNAIEDYLHGLGYRDAAAPRTREESSGELVITFTVNRGPLYRVESVDVSGNTFVPLADFEQRMQVRAGQPFSATALEDDTVTIETVYRWEGFASVKVESTQDIRTTGDADGVVPVAVHILVREGPRTMVNEVRITGNASVPDAALRAGLGLKPGERFFATQMAVDRDTMLRHYQDLGYPSATVEVNPGLSRDGTRADVVFTVREGVKVTVGHVLIVGNARTRTAVIQRELQITAGDPLGLEAIAESQRRLSALGLFRRAHIRQIKGRDETIRDLVVTVEEAPAVTITYGAGFYVAQRQVSQDNVATQRLEFAPRASFEIGRRNLFGKNRSVSLFSSFALRTSSNGSGYGFSEYRLLGTYREPRLLGTPADGYVTGVQEQGVRTSFNFSRRGVTAGVGRRLTRSLSLSGNYQLQKTQVFDENVNPQQTLLIDRLFPQVRLSSFSTAAIRDTRDDLVDPAAGHYASANAQIAGRRIGSEVGLAKGFMTAQLFRILPGTGTVFAGSARFGLATGFPRTLPSVDSNGVPIVDASGQPVLTEVTDLPASERFFAGGDTTVRGYALDALGTPATIDPFGFPIGGNALVILNAELRVPVRGSFGVVGFLDTGNVFAHASDIGLGDLRSAVGVGLRYKSPVGPIRIDLGFKLNREVFAGKREGLTALHISLGQAF